VYVAGTSLRSGTIASGRTITPFSFYTSTIGGTTYQGFHFSFTFTYSSGGTRGNVYVTDFLTSLLTTSTSTEPAFDFWISVSPASSSVSAGKNLPLKVNVGIVYEVPHGVVFSVSGLPTSVGTEDLSGHSCSPDCSINFTIKTFPGAAPGTYTLTITGVGGSTIHTTAFTLTVKA
jgi:hypothetical protein